MTPQNEKTPKGASSKTLTLNCTDDYTIITDTLKDFALRDLVNKNFKTLLMTDDELLKIFDEFEKDYQTSSGSMAFQKAASRALVAINKYIDGKVREAFERGKSHGYSIAQLDKPLNNKAHLEALSPTSDETGVNPSQDTSVPYRAIKIELRPNKDSKEALE